MSIIIKNDIKSFKIEGDFKSEIGYWGKKSPEGEFYIEKLIDHMAECDYMGIHEVLMGEKYRPYADLDWTEGLTEENFEDKKFEILKNGFQIMERLFPECETVNMFCSSGKNAAGKLKVSAHYIVTGIYYTDKLHIKHVLQRELGDPTTWKGWDAGVYNKDHLFRLPYCTKPGDDRKLCYAEFFEVGDVKRVKYGNFKDDKFVPFQVDESMICSGLITCIDSDEQVMPPPKGYAQPKKEKKDVNVDDLEDVEGECEVNEDWKGWTFDKARDVINRMHDKRAATHDLRLKGILSIAHLAKALRKRKLFLELAHLFAKKDPNYSESLTNGEYKYALEKGLVEKPRTFATMIKDANEDSPLPKDEVLSVDTEIPLTFYDKIDALLAKKPKLVNLKKNLMGCLRFCSARGAEQWFQHSTDGWWPIKNKDNFPFGSKSSNRKFQDTSLFDIMVDLQGTELFKAKCQTEGSIFWPYFGENSRPDIVNTFHGWPHQVGECVETEAVKAFTGHTLMMFGQDVGKYVINMVAKKLKQPRWRGKLVVAYGQYGGEGKNLLEAFITGVVGAQHCLSTPGTKHILGQGEAGYNPLAEHALVAFIQEAKAGGKSIVCDDKFKTWLTEDTQQIRKMRTDPYNAANYAMSFLWTNHVNALKADGPTLRRLVGAKMSDEKIWDKEYFDSLWKMTSDQKALSEIYSWLHGQDVSQFNPEDKPETEFMQHMADNTMTPTQDYIIELCNGYRTNFEVVNGDLKAPAQTIYDDYRAYCQIKGIVGKFIPMFKNFKIEMDSLNIVYKQVRQKDEEGNDIRTWCFVVESAEVEKVMQKIKKKREWKLLTNDAIDDE